MYAGRRRPETVSRKKRSVFLLMEKCFFLTYFLIGASGGLIQKIYEVGPLTCSKCQWKNSPIFSVRVPISCGISYASKN